MTRFRAPARFVPGLTKTMNLAGGEAYTKTARHELAALVLNSLVQDTFYEKAEAQLDRLQALAQRLADDGDLLFAAKAAVYARHEFGMRSISHALAVEIADQRFTHADQRGDWGARFFTRVVFRLDDMAEIASYWLARHQPKGRGKKTLPSAMKRGFAVVLAKAKTHQLAKWNGGSRGLNLRQLAHLVHPKGVAGSAVHQLRGGALAAADTHEVAMTRAGKAENVEQTKAQEWGRLLEQGSLGYLAALRNTRRIIEDPTSEATVEALFAKLTNERDIRESKVFPFQIITAAAEISKLNGPRARRALEALSRALDLSVSNVPAFEGPTLVALDDSGSMTTHRAQGVGKDGTHVVEGRSCLELGVLFAAIAVKRNPDLDLMLFSETARYLTLDPTSSTLAMAQTIVTRTQNKGTNHSAPFHEANRPYERVILISDEQGWMGGRTPDAALGAYEKRHGCSPYVHSWNLAGSATCQFPSHRTTMLAGFTPKVFDLLRQVEQDPHAMIHAIEAVTL